MHYCVQLNSLFFWILSAVGERFWLNFLRIILRRHQDGGAEGARVVNLSSGQKLQLIKVSGGRSQRQLAHQFNIGKTQFQSILIRKAELLSAYEDNHDGSHKRAQ